MSTEQLVYVVELVMMLVLATVGLFLVWLGRKE